MGKKSFTLIELVMVIVIIGIIAAIAIPAVQNIKQKAINRSEQAVMAAVKTAINMKYMENIIKGVTPQWPCQTVNENPFELLSSPPPYYVINNGPFQPGKWQLDFSDIGAWEIKCPCLGTNASGGRYCEWIYYPTNYEMMKAGTVYANWPAWSTHSTREEMEV